MPDHFFRPQTLSAAKKSFKTHRCFCSILVQNFDSETKFVTQNMIKMTADLIPSRSVWFHCVFSSLLKSEFLSFSSILFKSVAKTYERLQKPKIAKILLNFGQHRLSLIGIGSESNENWANTTLNFDTFHLRLLRVSEVKKVSNGRSGIHFHYSGPHQDFL